MRTTFYVGIDPGKEGAIAILTPGGDVHALLPIPMVKAGKKGRNQYDMAGILNILEREPGKLRYPGAFFSVERADSFRIGKMRGDVTSGAIANFNRGVNRGLWEGLLSALHIPYELVLPRVWQAKMHAGTPDGTTKQRSLIAVARLFPTTNLKRTKLSRGPDDGLAEALLIAEHARRTHGGAAIAEREATMPEASATVPPENLTAPRKRDRKKPAAKPAPKKDPLWAEIAATPIEQLREQVLKDLGNNQDPLWAEIAATPIEQLREQVLKDLPQNRTARRRPASTQRTS